MPAPRLVLAPRQHDWVPDDLDIIIGTLRQIKLIGAPLPKHHYYSAGPAFLDYLTFLGCAPTVVFEPPTEHSIGSGDFYHVQLSGPIASVCFRSDGFSYTPKCPGCREPLSTWREWWSEGSMVETPCPSCGELLSPDRLNWRRRAGAGRFFIDILGIHAETVKPAPSLFEKLEQATGVPWLYFFVEDNGISSD